MVSLSDDVLTFRFPDVHAKAKCSVAFERTLRIPDDNRSYNLPPGLGKFPLSHVEDHAEKTPSSWSKRGGVFLPMYQAEALWIDLHGAFWGNSYPCAVKVAAGKINAVSGKAWSDGLSDNPQDYIVTPGQRWLDGFNVSEGLIRQFVAMPLGEGFTAEEQVTGYADLGGIQISVAPMKKEVYDELFPPVESVKEDAPLFSRNPTSLRISSMGLAPGGLMQQKINADKYGIDVWDTEATSRCFVHLANSEVYKEITGNRPPTKPPSAKEYTDAGLPWFDYFDAEMKNLKGSKILSALDSVAAKTLKVGKGILGDNEPINPKRIVKIADKSEVRDGDW
jgi:hypothetical protein